MESDLSLQKLKNKCEEKIHHMHQLLQSLEAKKTEYRELCAAIVKPSSVSKLSLEFSQVQHQYSKYFRQQENFYYKSPV
jgi:predicted nuclease with TOPRIM domain